MGRRAGVPRGPRRGPRAGARAPGGRGNHAELEERRNSLKRRLQEAEGELDRLLNLYATGEIDAEWLTTHIRERDGRIEHLKLLLTSVEADMASSLQEKLAAEQTEAWLRALADNLAEVEGDSIEAFQKRRELVELLVEGITTERDEDERARVNVTYRFGPPPSEAEALVSSVGNSWGNLAAKRKPSGTTSRHFSTVELRGVP
jgi:hypothetical protein